MSAVHQVIVSHGEEGQTDFTEHFSLVACEGEACALCASTAEDRARIVFVFPEVVEPLPA